MFPMICKDSKFFYVFYVFAIDKDTPRVYDRFITEITKNILWQRIILSTQVTDNILQSDMKGVQAMTNNELYELFCEHNIRSYCKGTYAPRNSYVKCHFLPKNGNKRVCDTTNEDINQVYDEMQAEGFRTNTIYGFSAALSAYFVFAVENGESDYNPVRSAKTIHKEL